LVPNKDMLEMSSFLKGGESHPHRIFKDVLQVSVCESGASGARLADVSYPNVSEGGKDGAGNSEHGKPRNNPVPVNDALRTNGSAAKDP